jgi:hypothetical protein
VDVRVEVSLEGFAEEGGGGKSVSPVAVRKCHSVGGPYASIVAEEMMIRRSLRFFRILRGRKLDGQSRVSVGRRVEGSKKGELLQDPEQ